MPDTVTEIAARHSLTPHPEGGFYREVYRSSSTVVHPTKAAARPASTAILFLLTPSSFSAFHRLCSDEAWHFYDGDPIQLVLLGSEGVQRVEVGPDHPVAVVPAGVWQAARCSGSRFSFCGCTVAPGFEFDDFELGDRSELIESFPGDAQTVREFTRT